MLWSASFFTQKSEKNDTLEIIKAKNHHYKAYILREHFNANNPTHLVSIAKDLGLV
ncbi:hypothetical protein R3X25_08950 [Lutibacter sp. TH_r2]|uniref:hypothetical protein n=1 Tax=Lutibacter sp. TH_r2 TaxID=3082083 RepID=UPI0029538F22|nr:hypothetical protein [Lutibacter sp. TH_r2]MDV7187406.1 hypothetical protein [Lutibacter sp. TH_r2]